MTNADQTAGLRACPFCGGKASFMEDVRNLSTFEHWVSCDSCGARSSGINARKSEDIEVSRQRAADDWNARNTANPPEDFVLVPREPTWEMRDAGGDAFAENFYSEEKVTSIYKAMIARAPSEGVGEEVEGFEQAEQTCSQERDFFRAECNAQRQRAEQAESKLEAARAYAKHERDLGAEAVSIPLLGDIQNLQSRLATAERKLLDTESSLVTISTHATNLKVMLDKAERELDEWRTIAGLNGDRFSACLTDRDRLRAALEDLLETHEWKRKPYPSHEMVKFRLEAIEQARQALAEKG